MFGNHIVKTAKLQRFSVFLKGNEGAFSGVLTEFDAHTFVFEQCQSVPTKEGETTVSYKGRVLVEREHIKYLVDAP